MCFRVLSFVCPNKRRDMKMKTRKYRVSWFAQTDHVEFHHEDMDTLSGATLLFGAICRLATTS